MTNPSKGLAKPTRMFVEFFWWLKNVAEFYPDVCIDVGAAGGTPSINRSFSESLHLAFEPQPNFIRELKKELDGYEHEIFEMALMAESGEMEITVPKNAFTATMISPKARVSDDDKLTVKVSTLDHELKDRLIDKKVLLKTDCQGGDLDVIKGGIETLKHCDVVIMETSLYRFWGNHHPDFYDIVSFMKSQGLVVFDILEGTFKPSNRALGQVDLVFVHENGPLRPNHHW
ncbi:MAG: FkbM family methyltransferase [Pseudomonadota bacterium]